MVPGKIEGFDCIISSKLPIGSGISSSAALECGLAKGLNVLFNLNLPDEDLIAIAREAEHSFVGTNCGIMDQFAVVKGEKNGFIKLDCETQEYDIITAEINPYNIVLLNTNVSHNLATSEYNLRREECNLALKTIQDKYPKYQFLAKVPMSILLKFESTMEPHLFKRACYVIEENYRVKKAVKALQKTKLNKLGKLLYQSHKGLKKHYNVSCKELDFLVDFSKENRSVIGSRMMGGGFGGCTINLIHKDATEKYISAVSKAYKTEFNIDLTPTIVTIGDGVTVKKNED